MSNLLVNTRDQQFVLFEQLGIEKLFETEAFKDFSKDDLLMIMNEAEKLAVNVIAPTLKEGDEEGCQLKDGKVSVPKCFREPYKKFCEGGWINPMDSPDVGGQGIPASVGFANSELFGAANYAFLMYPGLTHGAAKLIHSYGTDAQKEKYMHRLFSGEWTGTMCLTEPGAGSDVGALRTTAKRLPDGKYLITGTKCFISAGDHDLTPNIIHPVLARIEGDPAGTKGISIFIVPKYRVNDDGSLGEFNDVNCGGIEHKMGIKGSATATLNFGEDGKCIGELLGDERAGIKIMFQMMNEARLGTGMQGLWIRPRPLMSTPFTMPKSAFRASHLGNEKSRRQSRHHYQPPRCPQKALVDEIPYRGPPQHDLLHRQLHRYVSKSPRRRKKRQNGKDSWIS